MSNELDSMVENLKKLLDGLNEVDEGKTGKKNDFGSGVIKEYKTYPGAAEVVHNDNGSGQIRIPWSCRERRKIYDLGVETDTDDTQHSGTALADFDLTFSGKVSISNVRMEGPSGLCGNSLLKRIQDIHNSNVKS